MSEKQKLSVGQRVWLSSTNYRGVAEEPIEVEIAKIGRKYFEISKQGRSNKYDIDTLQQVTEYGYGARVYLSLQEILDSRERVKLNEEIRFAFSGYGQSKYSLETLRKIKRLISEHE